MDRAIMPFGLTTIFSLSPEPWFVRPLTILINLILLGLWIIVYFAQESDVAVIIMAAIFGIHSLGIWIVYAWTLIYSRIPLRLKTPSQYLINLLLVILSAIVVFTVSYATLIFTDRRAFTGIQPNSTRLEVLGFSFFISVTVMSARLPGSTRFIPLSGWALFAIGTNTIVALILTAFILTVVVTIISEIRQQQHALSPSIKMPLASLSLKPTKRNSRKSAKMSQFS